MKGTNPGMLCYEFSSMSSMFDAGWCGTHNSYIEMPCYHSVEEGSTTRIVPVMSLAGEVEQEWMRIGRTCMRTGNITRIFGQN